MEYFMAKKSKRNGWYSSEFKQRAIALAQEIGTTHAAPKLGISSETLGKWVWRDANGKNMNKKDTVEAQAAILAAREIKKLKQEVEELKKANFILKEVASFFHKDRSTSDLKRSLNSPNKSGKK